MRGSRDFWLFGLTLASAASALVSIAAAETLLAIACLCWLILRPARVIWPSYTLPLVAFMATTVLSLTMSPQPEIGMGSVRKFVLFAMAFLAASFVTTPSRARTSCKVLLIASHAGKTLIGAALPVALVAAIASGLIQHRISMSFQQQKFGPDTGRIELFLGGLRMIRDHPIFGVGPERIHSEFPRYYSGADLAQANFYYGHLENNVVQIGAERGLLCLAAFLWLIFELYASLITMLKTAGEGTRWIVLSAVAALTGYMVAGFFDYTSGDSEVLLLFLFFVWIPYGIREGVAADV